MKNYAFKIQNSGMAFRFVLIAFLSVFLVSCEKEQMEEPGETTVYNLLENFDDKKPMPGNNAPGDMSIAEIASENNFNELLAALSYVDTELDAGLVDLFTTGKDQYTVFAPTDAAFEALYMALSTDLAPVDEISDLPAELVLNVLLYHVTDGRRASNSVVPKKNIRTIETLLEGATFTVNKDLMITAVGSTANIAAADISASNGIVHVIDNVLLPIE